MGGITLATSSGAKIAITGTGIEIDDGMGAKITLQGPQVSVNSGAPEVRDGRLPAALRRHRALRARWPSQPTSPSPRVKVDGQPISTLSGWYTPHRVPVQRLRLAGAVRHRTVTVGATRMRSGDVLVLLQLSKTVCAPNRTPVTIVVTQARGKAV